VVIGGHRDPVRGYPLRLDDGPRRPAHREENTTRGIVRAADERPAARDKRFHGRLRYIPYPPVIYILLYTLNRIGVTYTRV